MHDDYLNEFPFLGVPNAQPPADDGAGEQRETFV
jgi:hypothetical protein